jgi:hypothetical protein
VREREIDQVDPGIALDPFGVLQASDEEQPEPVAGRSDRLGTGIGLVQAVEKAADDEMNVDRELAGIHTVSQAGMGMVVMAVVAVAATAAVAEDRRAVLETQSLPVSFVQRPRHRSDSPGFR